MRFVLVHGAFVGSWIWGPLRERLEEFGHSVTAPDLPGSGDDRTPVEQVTLQAYTDRICDVLDRGEEPTMLVANSMGGMVTSQAAARRPGRVARLVYVAAFLPADGQSLIDLTSLPEGADDLVQETVVVAGEPPVGELPESTVREANRACSEEVIQWALERNGRQPILPFTQPVALGERFHQIPRTYVICTMDRSIPPQLQRRMAREGRVEDVIELHTDHHPQLSRTTELARLLDQRARIEVAA